MRSCILEALPIVHSTGSKINLKMALKIGPKHVAGFIIYNLIKYQVVSVLYILYITFLV
jgi:hypothetical protein